jgi:hypothetical protein
MGEAKRRSKQLGDMPIEERFRLQMNAMGAAIDQTLNEDLKDRKIGFCLMMFDIGSGPGRCNYIANVDRDDVVVLLKEQLAYFEGRVTEEGHA